MNEMAHQPAAATSGLSPATTTAAKASLIHAEATAGLIPRSARDPPTVVPVGTTVARWAGGACDSLEMAEPGGLPDPVGGSVWAVQPPSYSHGSRRDRRVGAKHGGPEEAGAAEAGSANAFTPGGEHSLGTLAGWRPRPELTETAANTVQPMKGPNDRSTQTPLWAMGARPVDPALTVHRCGTAESCCDECQAQAAPGVEVSSAGDADEREARHITQRAPSTASRMPRSYPRYPRPG